VSILTPILSKWLELSFDWSPHTILSMVFPKRKRFCIFFSCITFWVLWKIRNSSKIEHTQHDSSQNIRLFEYECCRALSAQLYRFNCKKRMREIFFLPHFASPMFHIHLLKFEFQSLFPHHFIIVRDNVVAVANSFQ